jgi:Tol biopolymer transport system component
VAVLLAVTGCQVRREPAPIGVGLLRVAEVTRTTDRPALSPIAWSPDGQRFAYGSRDGVWVHGVGDRSGARIAPGQAVTAVAWSADADVLAYVDRGELYTVRPDGRERRRLPLRGVASHPVWAPSGDRLAVVVRTGEAGSPGTRLWLASPGGATLRQIQWDTRGRQIGSLGWYPGALYLFVGLASAAGDVIAEWWRVRIAYPDSRRLPVPQQRVVEAVPSPDGTWVAYVAEESGGERAYITRQDGSGRRSVSPPARRISGLAWAPRGDKIAYGVFSGEAHAEVYAASAAGSARLLVAVYRPEFPDPSAGLALAWSPDGARLAYGTNTGALVGPVWMARFAPR